MIGGVEVVLVASPLEDAFDAIMRLSRRRWPNGVFLDADETELIPLSSSKLAWRTPSREFFVFSDRATAETWDDLGPCPTNWNRMLHFLCPSSERGSIASVTIVVDELTPDIRGFLNDLQASFEEAFSFTQPMVEAA